MEKENGTKTVVPALRFPEFRGTKGWEEKKLTSLCDITNGKCNAQDHIEGGKYPLFDRSAVVKSSNNYLYDCEAIIIPGEGVKFVPKYYNGKFNLHQRAYALKDFSCNGKFLFYDMEYHSGLLAVKAVKSTVLSLRLPILQNFPLHIPFEDIEQQKIADCLSSLDDLIEATNRKIEALKAHKKGLMQRLFPKDGENVPELRFPEFQGMKEWDETALGNVTDYENGKAHENDIDEDGKFIVVNSKFISTEGEIIKKTNSPYCLANKSDILMVLSDVPNGRAIAKCFFVNQSDKYTVNQRICRLRSKNVYSKLLFYLINRNPYFLSFDDGVKQTNLKKTDVLECPLMIPTSPLEQQKIADCLSSLDELIEATSRKVEILKEHKKGLMQQLFPKI